MKRDADRAQDIREAQALGDAVEDKDARWLARYEESLLAKELGESEVAFVTEEEPAVDATARSGAESGLEAADADGATAEQETDPVVEPASEHELSSAEVPTAKTASESGERTEQTSAQAPKHPPEDREPDAEA